MGVIKNNRLYYWLAHQAEANSDKTFIRSVDQNSLITYREFYQTCCKISEFFKSNGFVKNDRVALMSNNSIEHLLTYIGTMFYGITICTIHVEMNALYLDEIIDSIKPKLILFDDQEGWELNSIKDIQMIPLGDYQHPGKGTFFSELRKFSRQAIDRVDPPVNELGDIASIFYTSGTSSKPKGVMYNYRDLFENAIEVARGFNLSANDRILDFRSFNWMSAQVLSALGVVSVGATLILARKFSSSEFFYWIRDHKVTIAVGNPTTINMLINKPSEIRGRLIPHLRFVTSSSAPLLLADWQKFEELYGVQISQGYGSSETGWISASHENCRKKGSVGKPLPYQNLTIVNDEGDKLPRCSIGYIELGPLADTEFKYLGEDGKKKISATGRILTGDTGYLDEDGFLFISGRQKELIIRGGINISPVEIENILLQLSGIAEAAVIGVEDSIYGESIAALVVLREGHALESSMIISYCKDNLTTVKIPTLLAFVDDLPKTDREKLDRKSLKQLWAVSEKEKVL
ncbi:MAG TPA: long-chain fatty acid--CoA ligase [Rhodospirillales bacterium]|jgi:acyl-coenzyme A synthetase/AMP-(fatty) acid ligase|nr:long-chain fatty acid--CoA ligase [Rhodospirillales bacterium]